MTKAREPLSVHDQIRLRRQRRPDLGHRPARQRDELRLRQTRPPHRSRPAARKDDHLQLRRRRQPADQDNGSRNPRIRLRRCQPPDLEVNGKTTLRSFGYDAANRRTGATDAEGHKIEIGYNERRPRHLDQRRPRPVANPLLQLARPADQAGRRPRHAQIRIRQTRPADLADRPQGKASRFAYDPEGDLTEVTRPNGVTTTNVYNEAGRLAETTSERQNRRRPSNRSNTATTPPAT